MAKRWYFLKAKGEEICSISSCTFMKYVLVIISGRSVRNKRDLTCAIGGDNVCDVACKGRGYKDGKCAWVVDTGEFSCECSAERRGIRWVQGKCQVQVMDSIVRPN